MFQNIKLYYHQVFEAKNKLFLITSITFALGILYAFTSPSEWTSSVKFFPESNTGSQLGAKLGDIASIAGISGLAGTEDNKRLSPDLYLDIITSTPYYRKLFDEQLLCATGNSIDIKSYYEQIHTPTIRQRIENKLSGIVDAAKNIILADDSGSSVDYPYEMFTLKETRLVKDLKDRIELNVDRKTGVIVIRSHFQDKVFAASTTTFTRLYLERYLNDFANKKERLNLEFIQSQLEMAKLDFERSRGALAEFSDQNISIANQSRKIKQEELRLQRDFDFSLYQNLATQRQTAELEVNQSTAILSVIQPVTIPVLRDSPKRVRIIILSIFLGFFLSVSWILRKELFRLISNVIANKVVEKRIPA